MFYLQKMIFILKDSENKEAVEGLAQKLREQGIGVLCFWAEELGVKDGTVEEVIDAAWTQIMHKQYRELGGYSPEKDGCIVDKDKKKSVEQLRQMLEENVDEEMGQFAACLWMTDMGDLVRVLRRLEQPVLALLHDNNRNQDFSASPYACENPEELDGEYMDRVYRRYKRLPWEMLTTDRCVLRETTVEDVDAFFGIYAEPEITRYTEGLFPEREQEIQYINDYIDYYYSFYNLGIWTIIEKAGGAIIGRAGLSYREGYEEPELGFIIGLPWQRQGFGEEVCRGILKYAFEEMEFPCVQAFVRTENAASLTLCRKLGMESVDEVVWEGQRHLQLKVNRYQHGFT